VFAEGIARWLLVLHTALAVAAVAAATHLVVWMRPFLRGTFVRRVAVRRFGIIAAALYLATFTVGNLVYPTYKVRVKVEYLQNPAAVADEAGARIRQREIVAARYRGEEPALPSDAAIDAATAGLPRATDKMARWFDAKEHWVAMGLVLSLGCMVLLVAWDPRRDGGAPAPYAFLLALSAAAALWTGAIIGVVTASWRAIG